MKISNIYMLLLAAIVFVACDPLKDVNSDLENNPTPIVNDLDFTMSDDDYETAGQSFSNFADEDEAKIGIPVMLTANYPQLGNGSSAIVEYDIYAPKQSEKVQFIYEVSDQDYDDQGHTYGNFDSFEDITEFLDWKYPSLESYEDTPQSFASPSNGDLVFLEYKYYNGSVNDWKDGFIYTNGTWEQASGFTEDEYSSMEEPYANFSNEDEALVKIPVFLTQKYLYDPREPGAVESFTYGLYSSGTVYGNLVHYEFDGTEWTEYSNEIQQVLKLGNINGEWVPDNTIKYTMTGNDYTLVATNYADINAPGVASMNQYGNYDITIWSDEEVTNSIADVLVENFGSEAEGQQYLVTYSVWTGSAGTTPSKHYIKTGDTYVLTAE